MNDQRIAELERRVSALEDQLEVTQVVLAYGPCVDSGSADAAAGLWTQDGTYEFQAGTAPLRGQAGMADMVRSPGHQAHLARGCAHVVTAPHVRVDGDRATATCYSIMHHHVPETGIFQVTRVSANHWELVRTRDGWRVAARVNRLLNGAAAARALLAESVERLEGSR